MGKIFLIGIVLLLVLALFAGYIVMKKDTGNSSNPDIKIIHPELAKSVALEYFPAYFRSVDMNEVKDLGYNTLYNLEGKPAAYQFIFKKKDFQADNLDEIYAIIDSEKNMNNNSAEIRGRYHTGNTYTIVTGATDTSDFLIRAYTGLPGVLVKKPEVIDKITSQNKDLKLGRIIFLSGMDIIYEANKNSELMQEGKSVSDDSYLVSIKQDQLDLVNNLRMLLKLERKWKHKWILK